MIAQGHNSVTIRERRRRCHSSGRRFCRTPRARQSPVLWRGGNSGDRSAYQAEVVHQGVVYDVRVDTTHTEALECAREIAARVP
ncbi:MAG: hypothetical protein JOY82_10655 [Streptosporangiaceae bacterium]|nr:hypothetical protein [Streptosporangiaceae bacterium]MBV9854964.1 hypothetical protein [Streptosporangiaceae bacterium]